MPNSIAGHLTSYKPLIQSNNLKMFLILVESTAKSAKCRFEMTHTWVTYSVVGETLSNGSLKGGGIKSFPRPRTMGCEIITGNLFLDLQRFAAALTDLAREETDATGKTTRKFLCKVQIITLHIFSTWKSQF